MNRKWFVYFCFLCAIAIFPNLASSDQIFDFKKAEKIFIAGKGVFVYPVLSTDIKPIGEVKPGIFIKIIEHKSISTADWFLVQPPGLRQGWLLADSKVIPFPTAIISKKVQADWNKRPEAVAECIKAFYQGFGELKTLCENPDAAQNNDHLEPITSFTWNAVLKFYSLAKSEPYASKVVLYWLFGKSSYHQIGLLDMLIYHIRENENHQDRQKELVNLVLQIKNFLQNEFHWDQVPENKKGKKIFSRYYEQLNTRLELEKNPIVGIYVFQGDRHAKRYNGTATRFHEHETALKYFQLALDHAVTKKAKIQLSFDIAHEYTRTRSNNKQLRIDFFQAGYGYAKQGLSLLQHKDSPLHTDLQRALAHNLTGWVYNLYLEKEFQTIFEMKKKIDAIDFDFENRSDLMLLLAESSSKLAIEAQKLGQDNTNYAAVCLEMGEKAFNYELTKRGGNPPSEYEEQFCRSYNALWNYKSDFQKEHLKEFNDKYDHLCTAQAKKEWKKKSKK